VGEWDANPALPHLNLSMEKKTKEPFIDRVVNVLVGIREVIPTQIWNPTIDLLKKPEEMTKQDTPETPHKVGKSKTKAQAEPGKVS
jgi:hypothetical protein